jgi:hypothetical protein
VQEHGHLAVVQSQIPDWLTDEVMSLPITTPHETSPAAFNFTQLDEPKTFSSLGDSDTNHLPNPPIQVCATELIIICSQK